jgi:hypothetical protein
VPGKKADPPVESAKIIVTYLGSPSYCDTDWKVRKLNTRFNSTESMAELGFEEKCCEVACNFKVVLSLTNSSISH